jgi:hypothetical protein
MNRGIEARFGKGRQVPEGPARRQGGFMRIAKTSFAGIFCLSTLFLVPASFAGNEFVLVGGTRAVIEGKQLFLIGVNSKRSIAPSGKYDTRDGRYSIVVKGNAIVIRDHTKELR